MARHARREPGDNGELWRAIAKFSTSTHINGFGVRRPKLLTLAGGAGILQWFVLQFAYGGNMSRYDFDLAAPVWSTVLFGVATGAAIFDGITAKLGTLVKRWRGRRSRAVRKSA